MRPRNTFSVIVTLTAVFALALPIEAKTDRIAFEADDVSQVPVGVERDWFTPGESMRYHVRGSTSVYQTDSDQPLYRGTSTVVVNWNVWPTFEAGRMWGTFDLALDEFDGGYTGPWVAEFTGDERVWIGHGVGHGYGEVDGYKVFYDLAWTPEGDHVTGYILTPGNK
jgi:hypothetical protein